MLKRLLEELVKEAHPNIEYTVNAHELWKDGLIKRKAFAVLDDLMGGNETDRNSSWWLG